MRVRVVPACMFLLVSSPIIPTQTMQKDALSLTLNINGGAYLKLSNGHFYAIDPKDRIYSSAWITPFKILLSESSDPQYPVRITNLQTGTSINGRLLSTQESEELQSTSPQMPTPPPTQPQPPNPPAQPQPPNKPSPSVPSKPTPPNMPLKQAPPISPPKIQTPYAPTVHSGGL